MIAFRPKMTRLDKKKLAAINQNKRSAKRIRNKLATTLNWMDVKKVTEDTLILEKNKEVVYVQGIKLTPHNIFIDEMIEQEQWIDNIRFCLNQTDTELYFGFVYSPVNIDGHINQLYEALGNEEDETCKMMIQDDKEKFYDFVNTHKEKEFFIMIRDRDPKVLHKRLNDLYSRWYGAGFTPKQLNQRDFYSYLMFTFENTLINDYVFSRGLMSYLNMELEYDAVKKEYHTVDHTTDFREYGEPIYDIRQDANLIERSKLAPTYFKEYKDHLEIGDRYVKCILGYGLPPVYDLGILTTYLNDPNVKVFMTARRLDMDLSTMLNKDYQKKLVKLDRSKDETEKNRLLQDLQSQKEYINDIVRKNDLTHNITIVFEVFGNSLKEMNERSQKLKNRLQTEGWKAIMMDGLQANTFKDITPLFIHSETEPIIRENYGVPMTSEGVAGLYPFIFETLDDQYGFLLGEELQNGGMIILDALYYIHHPDEAKRNNRVNANFIVAGRAGSGKTTAMNLLVRNFIKEKLKLIWIDPENKNAKLTKHYKGTYIDWGKRGNIINLFDLKPISFDDDDNDPELEKKKWDTELAIFNVIDDIKQVFQYLWENISEDELSLIGDLVIMSYKKVGITKNENGEWTSFKYLKATDMPTFSTFNDVIKEAVSYYENKKEYETDVAILRSLGRKMYSIMNEWSVYLNGHTTIQINDSERSIVSFGTKKLQTVSDNLKKALYHIMFTYSWSLCLDEKNTSAFVIDEAHTMILQGKISHLVAQFVRRSRKYKNIMVIATQEPRDFADDRVLTDGKAIFNNSVYKIILGLNKDACNDLKKLENINENEEYWIQRFGQGDALLMCGNRRIPIHVIATHEELAEMGAMFS